MQEHKSSIFTNSIQIRLSTFRQLPILHRRPDIAQPSTGRVRVRIDSVIMLEEIDNVGDELVDLTLVFAGVEAIGC